MAGTARTERRLFLLALLCVAVLLGALAWPMLRGEMYVYNDLLTLHLPFRHFYADCLRRGESFLWTPFLYSGFYLHGEGEAGMMHPLHAGLYRFLPLRTAFGMEFFLSYAALLAGTYALLRRWRLPRHACAMGAMAAAFSGFATLHFMHMNFIATAAHIPWMLLAADVSLRDRRPTRAAWGRAGFAGIVGSALLLGHPQFLWYGAVCLVGYLLALGPMRRSRRRWLGLAVAGGVGLLLGAVQLLPTLDALRESFRAASSDAFRFSYSMHPLRLAEMVVPRIFFKREHEFVVYNGALVLPMIAVLVLGWRRLGFQRRLACASFISAGAGIWLALGRHGGLYRAVNLIPIVGLFRCPSRYIFFTHAAGAVLVALGAAQLGRLWRTGGHVSRRERWPVLVIVVLALLVAGLFAAARTRLDASWDAPFSLMVNGPGRLLAGAGIAALAGVLVWLALGGRAAAMAALIVFLAADLGAFGIGFIHGTRRIAPDELHKFLAEDSLKPPYAHRNRVHYAVQSDQYTIGGVRLADGYSGLPPWNPIDTSEAFLRVAQVEWVIGRHRLPGWLADRAEDVENGWSIPDPLPRVRLLTNAQESDDPVADIATIDIAKVALVDRALDLPASAPGAAEIMDEAPGRITVRTNAPAPQLLVITERIHPGWTATCDAEPTELVAAYGIFIAVQAPAGKHTIDLHFAPASFAWGVRSSGLGLVILLGMGGIAYRKRTVREAAVDSPRPPA